MHELGIALSILEGAAEEIERQGGGQVCAVHLRLGPLSGVVPEALMFSYQLASEGTPLEGSALVIKDVPIRVFCETCNAEREPVSNQRLHCATCHGEECRVVSGDELELAALEFTG